MPPWSRAAETKGLVMVPLTHTRLCVLVELGNETKLHSVLCEERRSGSPPAFAADLTTES